MDLSIVRTGFLAICAIVVALFSGQSFSQIPKEKRSFVIIRGVVGAFGYGGMVFGISNLPLMIFNILVNTAPLFTSIFGFYLNGEVITKLEMTCMAGAFAGVVVLSLNNDAQSEN